MNVRELQILIDYNSWASRRVLQHAARLGRDTLTQAAPLSHGSLFGTLIHILDAQWYWRLGCQEGILPVERLGEQDFADMASLQKRWVVEDDLLAGYVRSLTDDQVNEREEYRWPEGQAAQQGAVACPDAHREPRDAP